MRGRCAPQPRLLFPPGDRQRLLVRPGPVRAAPEVRELAGIHGAAHPGQQEGVDEERGQLSGQQRHREEAGALLRLNAHKEAVFPAEKVAESISVLFFFCFFFFYLTALGTPCRLQEVSEFISLFFFFSSVLSRSASACTRFSATECETYSDIRGDAPTGTAAGGNGTRLFFGNWFFLAMQLDDAMGSCWVGMFFFFFSYVLVNTLNLSILVVRAGFAFQTSCVIF